MKTYLENTFELYQSNNNIRLLDCDCPYCSHRGKVYVRPDIKQVYCFHCSKSYFMYSYFAEYEGLSVSEFIRTLCGEEIDSFIIDKPNTISAPIKPFFPELVELPTEAIEYLTYRDIPDNFISTFKIKYSPYNSTYQDKIVYSRNRVIFPIFDRHGNLVSWQGRDISGKSSCKYLFSPDFKASENLYNIWNIPDIPEYLIICEGIFDVFGWYRAGFKNVVCTFGKKISEFQTKTVLSLKPNTVFFAWDYDCYGEMYRAIEKIQHIVNCRVIELPVNKDSDDCHKQELIECFVNAQHINWKKLIVGKSL